MSFSRDMFRVHAPSITNAHETNFGELSAMENVLPTYEKYLTFCKDAVTYLEKTEEAMSTTNRILKKLSWIKQDKDMLFYYFKDGDLFTVTKTWKHST